MDIISIFEKFPTQKSCIDYLEQIRWENGVYCPYCASKSTYKLTHNNRDRHHCNGCQKSFSVTINTIFHDTRLPLQKWFLAISIIADAKKSISSRQLARHLKLPVKTAYSVSQRVRKALLGGASPLLTGIIEIDETYIGGKPRGGNNNKRGRGTKKTMVVGIMERKGNVIAQSFEKINQKKVRDLIIENVDLSNSEIHTDEYGVYNRVNRLANHERVNHGSKEYVRGSVHTNSIEGFWALAKRAHYGQHHHYSKKYTNLYIAEAAFKYNNRKNESAQVFNSIITNMLYV